MKLLFKFNLIFIFCFAVGLAVSGYFAHIQLQDSAREQILQQARLMMDTASGSRLYTDKQIAPLLNVQRYHLAEAVEQYVASLNKTIDTPASADLANLPAEVREEFQRVLKDSLVAARDNSVVALNALPKDPTCTFYPQTIPAYAATEEFNFLREQYPEYSYKESTLNPTNPRDRATDWEADIIQNLRNDPKLSEVFGIRQGATGESLYLARPITITSSSCLECHSTPDKAPSEMIKMYGSDNGFGWKLNETVGAQLVQVPMALPIRMAKKSFFTMFSCLALVSLVTLLVLNLVIYLAVIAPIKKLSALANEASLGDQKVEEYTPRGNDEIATLAHSFNRMSRSLKIALDMLKK